MLNLDKTTYSLAPEVEQNIVEKIKELENKVNTLRNTGQLTQQTLIDYYGTKKYEQVAASNAIEGNTLSAGETELAILKGITTTGHDPAYVKDAISLGHALDRLVEFAQDKSLVTNNEQLLKLHEIIMGDRSGGGMFRNVPVRIKGADHRPPKTRLEVTDAMDDWQKWSIENKSLPSIVRGTILHAWLAHIHPFVDGNGRTARAITNLELVRAGYPPIIVRKKERDRYIDALAESDAGGDIGSFFELVIERASGALTGLEQAAKNQQDYDPVHETITIQQTKHFKIWETSVALLIKTIEHHLQKGLHSRASISIREFESPLDLDDYLSVVQRQSASRTWCFIVNVAIPGFAKLERLAYISYRMPNIYHHMNDIGGPTIYWSKKNPSGYPRWIPAAESSPFCTAMTIKEGVGDEWYAQLIDGEIKKYATTALAKKIATALTDLAINKKL